MDALIADPAAAPVAEPPQQSTPESANGAGEPPASAAPAQPATRSCANCGAAMAEGQGWCLQCGAGAPGSLSKPGWRSAGAIVLAAGALALGAAAAGYAALSNGSQKPSTVTATVARAATPPPAPPATSTPSAIPAVPKTHVKLPKIPLAAATLKPAPTSTPATSSTPAAGTTTPSSGTGGGTSTSEEPTAILLDTNAASTYNPYAYPAANFGDPSLAIDGDTSTAWTAQVDPATAPRMAEGLLVDLKSAQKLSALAIVTTTPGMTVQVRGANGKTVPGSITDPAWVKLSHATVPGKRHARITLLESKHAFRFVTLWISRAPSGAGHVAVNEVELFPAG